MSVHDGHRARKRAQFREHGLDAFADHEALELLLYYAVPRADTNPVAHRLLERFGSLDGVINAAKVINGFYHGENTLYKDPSDNLYYLVVNLSEHTAGEFNKVCNIISEYVTSERPGPLDIEYFKEHYEVIVKDKAVQVLKKL